MMSFKPFKGREYLIITKISAGNLMLRDKINVAEWFRAKSPSLARCKEGDLPVTNFSVAHAIASIFIRVSTTVQTLN